MLLDPGQDLTLAAWRPGESPGPVLAGGRGCALGLPTAHRRAAQPGADPSATVRRRSAALSTGMAARRVPPDSPYGPQPPAASPRRNLAATPTAVRRDAHRRPARRRASAGRGLHERTPD